MKITNKTGINKLHPLTYIADYHSFYQNVLQVFIFNFINTHWILDIYFKAGAVRIKYYIMTYDVKTCDIMMYDVLVITFDVIAYDAMTYEVMTFDIMTSDDDDIYTICIDI